MTKKLNYIKVKLFFIRNKKKTSSYKHKLENNSKVYFIFNILLLKLASFKTYL